MRTGFVMSAIAAAICAIPTLAGTPSTVDRFEQRYHGMKAIRCTFQDAYGTSGTLQAVKGGKYRVTLPDRTIVCDGRTVWNVTPSQKNVIINTYRHDAEDLSLERIFFGVMTVYRPTLVRDFRNKQTAIIKLLPPADNARIAGVRSLDIELDASMRVRSVNVTDDMSTTKWTITALALDPAMNASSFTYSIPPGWEAIDLR